MESWEDCLPKTWSCTTRDNWSCSIKHSKCGQGLGSLMALDVWPLHVPSACHWSGLFIWTRNCLCSGGGVVSVEGHLSGGVVECFESGNGQAMHGRVLLGLRYRGV